MLQHLDSSALSSCLPAPHRLLRPVGGSWEQQLVSVCVSTRPTSLCRNISRVSPGGEEGGLQRRPRRRPRPERRRFTTRPNPSEGPNAPCHPRQPPASATASAPASATASAATAELAVTLEYPANPPARQRDAPLCQDRQREEPALQTAAPLCLDTVAGRVGSLARRAASSSSRRLSLLAGCFC